MVEQEGNRICGVLLQTALEGLKSIQQASLRLFSGNSFHQMLEYLLAHKPCLSQHVCQPAPVFIVSQFKPNSLQVRGQEHPVDDHVAEVQDGVGVVVVGVFDQPSEVLLVELVVGEGDQLVDVLSFDVVDDLVAHL